MENLIFVIQSFVENAHPLNYMGNQITPTRTERALAVYMVWNVIVNFDAQNPNLKGHVFVVKASDYSVILSDVLAVQRNSRVTLNGEVARNEVVSELAEIFGNILQAAESSIQPFKADFLIGALMGVYGKGQVEVFTNRVKATLAERRDEGFDSLKESNNSCFACGTPILIDNFNYLPIEKIKKGDTVTTFDPWSGQFSLRNVLRTSVHLSRKIMDITTDQRNIRVTPNHLMWTTSGWSRASDLFPGDKLTSLNKGNPESKVVHATLRRERIPVFNLYTEHNLTFVAGGFIANSCSIFPSLRLVLQRIKGMISEHGVIDYSSGVDVSLGVLKP